ncbi:MAG TPA: alpha/beta fold hydrolase [Steroidobacteraceae bacterium]|nr:alpha/beta fold hydrolase [Steroidobacteraceae bacterium]
MRLRQIEGEDEVVLEPAAGGADAAVIWLHGLGADGYDFVPLVPQLKLPAAARVRFVFPHAEIRPVTVNAGYAMRAWYDIRELTPQGRDDEAGLEAARARVERYIERERAEGILTRRIVLAGFSQGGATALHVGLRHAAPLGGIIALSGYLPLRERLRADLAPANRAVPILMCHGREDVIVLPTFGEQSRDTLLAAGAKVEWREYSVGHQLCEAEIHDIAAWLSYHLELVPQESR